MFHKKKPYSSSIVALNANRRLALSAIALLGSTMLTQPASAVDYSYGEVSRLNRHGAFGWRLDAHQRAGL